MTDIGELVVRIKADASQLQNELAKTSGSVRDHAGKMEQAFDGLKEQFKELIPAITLGSIVEFTKSSIEAAAHINTLAQKIGFAGETLSALNVPLKQNGSDVDEFASSIVFMSRNIQLASEGNQELIKRFDSLGLSVTKLKSLSPEQQFREIALALGQTTDQGKLTADAMAIFGRSAAALIPTLRETKGNIQEVIDKQKSLGNSLTQEELNKVKEFDDAWTQFWERMKVKAVEATAAFDDFMKKGQQFGDSMPSFADRSDRGIDHFGNKVPKSYGNGLYGQDIRGTVSTEYPTDLVHEATFLKAKGDNKDILASSDAEKSAKALEDYIQNLESEAEALQRGKEALAIYRAEKGAATAAGKEISDLTAEKKSRIDEATMALLRQAEAQDELKKKEEEHMRVVAQMEAEISSSLADIAINYKSLGQTATSVLQQIAKQIIEMQITTPLVEAIGGTKGSPGLLSGMFKMLGFASGGMPPIGVPSIVGENGPEIFVPSTAGTIIPNGKIGGTSVIVQQTIALNPGATEQTVAQLQNLVPSIMSATHASVMQAIQNGGSESRIVGRRS